ncbi:helix-turn-helix domain-containing protein [Shinella sp.]|uniref:helix-turn-helix domain-containing protein n=1 Tax=Shinella sp. TaxID=1870904 RepID=UPI0029AEDD28|nr:helix-turn-helix domain-containing protein [Shinella sp.]MDX3978596.1 helix-turn-helix domain-containing protein [Shinella sp.]
MSSPRTVPLAQTEMDLAERLDKLINSANLGVEDARAALVEANTALRAQEGRQGVLAALYQTATEIIDVHVVGQVLEAAVSRAKALLKADLGYLALYDAQSRGTRVTATVGSVSPGFGSLHVPLGIGMGGRVSQMRVPFVTADYLADERLVHLPRVDEGIRSEGIRGMVGVPLIARHQFLGALFVADRTARRYTDEDVACLQGLAALIAVALENARLFEREDAALKRTQLAYQSLNTRLAASEREASLHRRMVALVGRNGSLDELAAIVEKELGAKAGFVPTADALHDEGDGDDRRYQARVGSEQVWTLTVDASAPLTGSDRRLLERIVQAAETLLLRKGLKEIERAWRGGIALQALLSDGLTPDDAEALAEETGVDLNHPCKVFAFKAPGILPEKIAALLRGLFGPRACLIGQYSKTAMAFVLEGEGIDLLRLQEAINTLAGEPVAIGTAPCRDPLSRARQSALNAVHAAEMILALGQAGTASDLRIPPEMLLLRNAEAEDIEAFIAAALGPLNDPEHRNAGDLVATLRAYFDAGSNAVKASAALGVHYKTMAQRLERISRLTGLDFKDSQQVLRVQIALLLLGIKRPTP